MLFVIENIDR